LISQKAKPPYIIRYYKRKTEKAMNKIILVTTTFDSKREALELAKQLLEKRLIACAQLSSPVESLYWWKGVIEPDTEYKLLVKSIASLWDTLKKEIELLHPYDVPEILLTPVLDVNDAYKKWILEELQK
jgi:periplasmic divalent cation tolerance protein